MDGDRAGVAGAAHSAAGAEDSGEASPDDFGMRELNAPRGSLLAAVSPELVISLADWGADVSADGPSSSEAMTYGISTASAGNRAAMLRAQTNTSQLPSRLGSGGSRPSMVSIQDVTSLPTSTPGTPVAGDLRRDSKEADAVPFDELLARLGQEHRSCQEELLGARWHNGRLRQELRELRAELRRAKESVDRGREGSEPSSGLASWLGRSPRNRSSSNGTQPDSDRGQDLAQDLVLVQEDDTIRTLGTAMRTLRSDGPNTRPLLQIATVWTQNKRGAGKRASPTRSRTRTRGSTFQETIPISLSALPTKRISVSRLVASPGSPKRTCWDLFGAMLIFYDLYVIPLSVFEPPANGFTTFMDWLSIFFWTANMAASLCVGYVINGETIMEPRRILVNYLKTWFVIDLGMIVPDWVFVVISIVHGGTVGNDSDASDLVQLMRILRLARMSRLVRLLKLRNALDHIDDMIDTESVGIIFNIIKMLGLLLIANHLIGCAWFYLSVAVPHSMTTWVMGENLEGADWAYLYFTSVHWAITQFTPASMSVQPQNIHERIFSIVVVIFALVGFAYIVGSITGSITQLRSIHQDRYNQFWILRRFMRLHKVPQELSTRIGKYLEYAYHTQKDNITEKDVKVFQFLSEQLHSELQWEIARTGLDIHPLFRHLEKAGAVTMHRFAHKCLIHVKLVEGDSLFLRGELGSRMYLVWKGTVGYSVSDDAAAHESLVGGATELAPGDAWISEPVLWLREWLHVGELKAYAESDMLAILADQFQAVVNSSAPVYNVAQVYAREFVKWLTGVNDHSDLFYAEEVISAGLMNGMF